jgi:crotonobetainyl-CoA:carnitine CoA-transferase CaiB-like acyl-CoA transferase
MNDATNIFSNLKVLDLASFITGPAATTILADFGADVVKVEPPETGDPYRFFSTTPPNPVSDFNSSELRMPANPDHSTHNHRRRDG